MENPTEKTSEGGSKKCVIIGGIVALAIIAVALLVGFFVFHRELKGMEDISKALKIFLRCPPKIMSFSQLPAVKTT